MSQLLVRVGTDVGHAQLVLAHDGAHAQLSRHRLRLVLLDLLELDGVYGIVRRRRWTVLSNEFATILFRETVPIDLAVDVAPGGRLVQEWAAEVFARIIYRRRYERARVVSRALRLLD